MYGFASIRKIFKNSRLCFGKFVFHAIKTTRAETSGEPFSRYGDIQKTGDHLLIDTEKLAVDVPTIFQRNKRVAVSLRSPTARNWRGRHHHHVLSPSLAFRVSSNLNIA
jgi:hypothetical protein